MKFFGDTIAISRGIEKCFCTNVLGIVSVSCLCNNRSSLNSLNRFNSEVLYDTVSVDTFCSTTRSSNFHENEKERTILYTYVSG